MESIAAVMFEPVGCLAEFHADEFDAAAKELFGMTDEPSADGSHAYWRLVGLMEQTGRALAAPAAVRLEALELAAVERAELYEDVGPAFEKLHAAGATAHLASSLSRAALRRFVERFSLAEMFASAVSRDDARGALDKPLQHAIAQAALAPARTIYLVDTAIALEMAKRQGVNAVLMINDYDDGRALAERRPAGGVVSLAELADALMLIEQRSGLRASSPMPRKPFELFEPS